MENLFEKVINTVQASDLAYCKFLAANDTKSTGSHQYGYLLGKAAWKMFFDKEPTRSDLLKIEVEIAWQDSYTRKNTITYYGSKDELRLTRLGPGFPFREDENVGDLLVLAKTGHRTYSAYVLSHDEDIENVFSTFNISITDTNKIIPKQFQKESEKTLRSCFTKFLEKIATDFPPTIELARTARDCFNSTYDITNDEIAANADRSLLSWINAEFQLFKLIENSRYSMRLRHPFNDVEEFIKLANTILQRRKSRAGKSLEHHLAEIFTISKLQFETQQVTEDNKRPDFIFPGISCYLDPSFNPKLLIILACKTTCKDRWRQVLNEADRVKTKYLFTLQPGISSKQLREMHKYHVRLVAPQQNIANFPFEFRRQIISLQKFIEFAKFTQHNHG